MDFESPDVMKDFPGLYASELSKKSNNDSEYSDDSEKVTKKDILIGKRKDKKDKKDKERGYAALEGESSAEENCDARSPTKSKKTKSFKFPTKYKEKREKSRDKEKEIVEKRKDKDKKTEKKVEKEKFKLEKKEKKLKQSADEAGDIADELPIFGVSIETAVERSRCHDGVDIPLPARACIDYIQMAGLGVEGVYKVSGPKSKVLHIRKLYNQRKNVDLSEYDVPTSTSLLKMFVRDLPEPIFTMDLLIRFEEAGAILNVATREKHLRILIDNLPPSNRLLLSWLLIHFDNIISNERANKMNLQNIVAALSPVLQTSNRLLTALLYHCKSLFPDVILEPYFYPLTSSSQLPDDLESMENELCKQESLLSQIHNEMNAGFISKHREELLWEVQRIITQLKRKLKVAYKDKEAVVEKNVEDKVNVAVTTTSIETIVQETLPRSVVTPVTDTEQNIKNCEDAVENGNTDQLEIDTLPNEPSPQSPNDIETNVDTAVFTKEQDIVDCENNILIHEIELLQLRNKGLLELKEFLQREIKNEKSEILSLKNKLVCDQNSYLVQGYNESNIDKLDEIMDLLRKENQILQIKKISLVRVIMDQHEACIDLRSKLAVISKI